MLAVQRVQLDAMLSLENGMTSCQPCQTDMANFFVSVCLSGYLSASQSVCHSISQSFRQSASLSTCLPVCMSVYLSVCLSVKHMVQPAPRLSVKDTRWTNNSTFREMTSCRDFPVVRNGHMVDHISRTRRDTPGGFQRPDIQS